MLPWPAVQLIFARHALPVRIERADGAADPGLSDVGRQQAVRLAAYLTDGHEGRIDAVVVSPARRARETAAPLADALGVAPSIVDAVNEFDEGSDTYVPMEELKATGDPRWFELIAPKHADAARLAHRDRVVAAVEDLIAASPGRRVAVVCHGGVISAYVSHILGLADPVGFFYPQYTSVHRVLAASSGERSVLTLNETAHLRGSGLARTLHE